MNQHSYLWLVGVFAIGIALIWLLMGALSALISAASGWLSALLNTSVVSVLTPVLAVLFLVAFVWSASSIAIHLLRSRR